MVDAANTTAVDIGLPSDRLSSLPNVERPAHRSPAKPLPASTAGNLSIRYETCHHRKEMQNECRVLMTDARSDTLKHLKALSENS